MKKVGKDLSQNLLQFKSTIKQIFGSAQLIDFFIHDMLDFAILSEKKVNFTKTIETFCLKETLEFVREIFSQKISVKEINFKVRYEGFDEVSTERTGQPDDVDDMNDEKLLDHVAAVDSCSSKTLNEMPDPLTESDKSVHDDGLLERNNLDIRNRYLLRTDRKRLLQVLINLASNAIKFTKSKGTITITAMCLNGGRQLKMSVQDTGIGIKAVDQKRLFKLFGCIQDEMQ